MEKPSKEEITKMFLDEASGALGIKKKKAAVGAASELQKRPKPAEAPEAMRIGPKEEAAENFPGKASKVFTPDVDFWQMKREEMIEELAQNIFDIRMSRNPEIAKAIPEIGLDLSGPYIDWILTHNKPKRITPGTKDPEDFMRRWDRIQAKRWLEYLEGKRYAGRETEGEKPAMIEPAPKPRPAEAAPRSKPEEVEAGKERAELSEGQKKIFDHLMQRSGIGEISKALEEKYRRLQPKDRKDAEEKKESLLQNIESIFTRMIKSEGKKFPRKDLNYFQKYFLDNPKVMEKYRSERGEKVSKGETDLLKFRYEFADYMGDIAKRSGEFSNKGVEWVKSYFRTYTLLEQRLFETGSK